MQSFPYRSDLYSTLRTRRFRRFFKRRICADPTDAMLLAWLAFTLFAIFWGGHVVSHQLPLVY